MRVYVAAPYGARAQVAGYALELERDGITPTCFWAHGTREIDDTTVHAASALSDQQASAFALDDLGDVASSDALVVLTETASDIAAGGAGSGGRHIETGYALALGKQVIVVGTPDNIFHRCDLVTRVDRWSDARALLRRAAIERPALSAWE